MLRLSELQMTNAAVFADPAHGVIDKSRPARDPASVDDMAAGTSQDVGQTRMNSYTKAPVVSDITSNMLITLMLLFRGEGGFAIYNILV
jgi:hypothetical protein